jgi:predicted O-methyltransferase YrrM
MLFVCFCPQENYGIYYELALKLVRKGGCVAVDNVLCKVLVIGKFDFNGGTKGLASLQNPSSKIPARLQFAL